MKEKDKLTILILSFLVVLIAVRLADANMLFGDKTPTATMNFPIPEETIEPSITVETDLFKTPPVATFEIPQANRRPIIIIGNVVYADDYDFASAKIENFPQCGTEKVIWPVEKQIIIKLINDTTLEVYDNGEIKLSPEILMISPKVNEMFSGFLLADENMLSITLDDGATNINVLRCGETLHTFIEK